MVALVGPSGSNKNEITRRLCETGRFIVPKAYTTKKVSDSIHTTITEEEFICDSAEFVETTRYAGYAYGTKWKDITSLMNGDKYVVMPMDLSGAIAMKRHYPTVIIFCKCKREQMIESILEKDMDNHEKMLRLVSLENELKKRHCVIMWFIQTAKTRWSGYFQFILQFENPYRTAKVQRS